jgi:hypothetical protein
MTATAKSLIIHKLPRLNEDRFCPPSVKDGTVSVFHTKNRNVLFTTLKYNGSPGGIENHTERFLFSVKPHGDSSGRLKSCPFKLQNTRGEVMRVSLKRADPRHIIVTNSQDGAGKGPKSCSDLVASECGFVDVVGAKPACILLKSTHRLPQSNHHPPLLSPFHDSQHPHFIS